jgi:hypothetical protein
MTNGRVDAGKLATARVALKHDVLEHRRFLAELDDVDGVIAYFVFLGEWVDA